MVSHEDLYKLKVSELRGAIRSWQHANRISGYSTMRKGPLIEEVMREIQLGQPSEVTLEKHLRKVLPKPVPAPRKMAPKAAPKAAPKPKAAPEESVLLDDKVVKFKPGTFRRQLRLSPTEKLTPPILRRFAEAKVGSVVKAFGREYKVTPLMKRRGAFGLALSGKR